jgi:hypothetical protein
MYIELAKICGTGARTDAKHELNEYILMIIQYVLVAREAPLTPCITFSADVFANELKSDPELIDGKQLFYFTVGLTDANRTRTKF